MTAASENYRTNAATFTAHVEAVPEDRWENQSPCAEWNARDVVRHCIDTSAMFLGLVDQKLPPAPSVDEDPRAAWASARDTVQGALEDPAIARLEYDGQLGRSTFEQAVDRFIAPDLLIHTWDLARATGLDDRLDQDQMEHLLAAWEPLDEMMRVPGGFGPKVEPPAGADAQTRLLAFTGRHV